MSDLVNIKDERFWQILFDEACVEGQQAERIEKELKKITVEPVDGEWIPVSERLPEVNGVYCITRKINDGERIYYIPDSAYWDGISTWHDDTRVNHSRPYLTNVIAWMQLPAPCDMRKKVEE